MKPILSILVLMVVTGCHSQPAINPNPVIIQPSARVIARSAVVPVPGGPVTLAWDKSPSANAVTYKVYWSRTPGSYTNSMAVGTNLTATVTNLIVGVEYFFAATASEASGLESDFSNEAAWTVTPFINVVELFVWGQYAASPSGPYTNYPTPIYRGPATNMQFFRTVANLVTNGL